jgi:fatty-acyl-CoA synthase
MGADRIWDCPLVTVNPNYVSDELAYVLGQSKASGILVQPDYRGRNLLEVVDKTDLRT